MFLDLKVLPAAPPPLDEGAQGLDGIFENMCLRDFGKRDQDIFQKSEMSKIPRSIKDELILS